MSCKHGFLAILVACQLLSVSPASVGPGDAAEEPSDFWKNSFDFPDDPWAQPSAEGTSGWIKFTILTSDPSTVYFQDSVTYPFHYDFATEHLDPFLGMSPSEFDAVTLYQNGQLGVLGAVILPPLVSGVQTIDEYGIQFVGLDPIPPSTVVALFNAVEAAVNSAPGVEAFYFPTYEQLDSAQQNQAYFAAQGITVSSTARWAVGNTCYSPGWSLGELKFFAGDEIRDAFLDGNLLPEDILLTDAVPSEIPYVSGVLTLQASTPNSHVAILAQTYGVPFVHLVATGEAQKAQELVGRKIALRAVENQWGCWVKIVDVEDELDDATIAEILELKAPPDLNISPVRLLGSYSANTDGLVLSDIRYFGGKAANFGLLRRAIPLDSPVAGAFSFDLWDGFMEQPLLGGSSLREEIASRLAAHAGYPPPDVRALSEELDGIRDLIKDTSATSFDPAIETAVVAALEDAQYGFDPTKKIRFRSSTNVEDSDRFTGAGLYDSYSGCLADDLDGNAFGPSLCDPTKPEERGVFRAIRKVLASFYNDDAYLQRQRYGLDEGDVGMAVLFHHSFPDEIELANGVATLSQDAAGLRSAYLVSQVGASSVTNPEPGAIPEEVSVEISETGVITPTLVEPSNLVVLGETVMSFPEEYVELTELLLQVADEFELATGSSEFILEFEYKKLEPGGAALPVGGLVVKQVRRIPELDDTPLTPFLINEPARFCTFQGEQGTVTANHRGKSRFELRARNMWLTEENLAQGVFVSGSLEYADGCLRFEQEGLLADWPNASHSFTTGNPYGTSLNSWVFDELENPRTYRLPTTRIPLQVSASKSPLIFPSDLNGNGFPTMTIEYEDRVINLNPSQPGTPPTTLEDEVQFWYCPEDLPYGPIQLKERIMEVPGEFFIQTRFYWPPDPDGIIAGYTAPLVEFEQTIISGLTTDPIVLQGEFSQTYRPEHHNFQENFIFEPFLDPNLTSAQRAELEAAEIRLLWVQGGPWTTEPYYYTFYSDETWGDECLACSDGDGDGRCAAGPWADCDDANPDAWGVPSEVRGIVFPSPGVLSWDPPSVPGAASVLYDLLRSGDPADFLPPDVCLDWDVGGAGTTDAGSPAAGSVFHYLVRATNACPDGAGPLGARSSGAAREGRVCP